MTNLDDHGEATDNAPVRDVQRVEDWSSDHLLSVLVGMTQKHGWAFDIRLIVRGQVLVGQCIGRDAWFEELVRMSKLKGSTQTAVSFLESMRDAVTGYYKEAADDDDVDSIFWAYMHLKDARPMPSDMPNGEKPAPGEGTLWRVRLSDVSAWSLQS